MTRFWAELPADRVIWLRGVAAEALALVLDPLPAEAPVVVTCHPVAEKSVTAAATAILGTLETTAMELLHAWLPGAAELDGPGGAGVAAVRALASRHAAASRHFGPFLDALAMRALRRDRPPRAGFTWETRAAGLARVIADSFGRDHLTLLIPVPAGFPPGAEEALVAACEGLAGHGDLRVWLAGELTVTADRVTALPIRLPRHIAEIAKTIERTAAVASDAAPGVSYPALAGRPHPGSAAEQALEAALASQPWACGRTWNQTYHAHPLANPIKVDLWWQSERCIVEIDGADHRSPWKFEADRRRDVQLQLDGYAVLRFTNAQILSDLDTVLSQLRQLLTGRRTER